jgi:tRNA A-37 threonylcarbamoyl transferase component Bud32
VKRNLTIIILLILSSLVLGQQGVNIIIKTNIPGAAIFLDSTKVGNTGTNNMKIIESVPPGKHEIRIEMAGYVNIIRTITVDELSNNFEFTLEKVREEKINLLVESNTPGAAVYLDEKPVGITDENGKLTIPSLSKGNYTIQIEKTGYTTFEQQFSVGGDNIKYNFVFEKKDEPGAPAGQGRLFLKCNVSGARVFVDDVLKGETNADTFILELSVGSHEVRLEKKGYETQKRNVGIENELDTMEDFALYPAQITTGDKKEPATAAGGIAPEAVFIILIFLVLIVVVFVLVWIMKSSRSLGMLGKFNLLKVIGKGGIATIYKAKDTAVKKIVALKVMDHDLIRDADLVYKFFSEGEAISKINEKFPDAPVVEVFDYGRDKEKSLGVPYIAMELLKGDSLLKLIKENGSASESHKLYIAREVARALTAAHKLKIFHGDITPDNIIVNGDRVTLIDFGVAVQEHDTYKNMDASITGKPVYMSPEQSAGQQIDDKSDVYSLGIILFFMFSGSPPFISKNPHEIIKMHQKNPIPEIKLPVSPAVKKMIYGMLEKDPTKRPKATRLEKTLDKLIGEKK